MRYLLLLSFILATYCPLCAEDVLYQIELKDGKQLDGYLEEIGIDRFQINIVFKGKVMGSKTVTAQDIVSKKVIVLETPETKEIAETEDKTSATDNPENKTEETADSETAASKRIPTLSGDLEQQYKKAEIACNENKQIFDIALGNLKIQSENTALTDSISKPIRDVNKALEDYVEALEQLNVIKVNQIRKQNKSAADISAEYLANEIVALQKKTESDIISAEAVKGQVRMVHKWIKSANLKPIPESHAKGDDAMLKRIQRINKKLAQLEGIRDTPTAYKTIMQFMENTDQFTLYIDTH